MYKKRGITVPCLILCGMLTGEVRAGEGHAISGSVEDGRIKAVLCAGCHGEKGAGKAASEGLPAIPKLAGQIPGYFVKAMQDYKSDKRVDPLMNAISKGLTDADIANLAAYYLSLK